MKYFFALALAIILAINVAELAPPTQAPEVKKADPIEASILSEETEEEPVATKDYNNPETNALLQILDIYVEEKRDFPAAQELIKQTPTTQANQKILQLYQTKIQSRLLNFEEAQLLLEQVDSDELALLKAAVLIASDDRNKAGAYLHHLVDNNPDPYIKSIALSLLNIYYKYDTHRDTDEKYLWTLFAQKLGELSEFEISLYLAKKASDKSPEYRDAWIIKGYNELSLKKFTDAEESLLRAYQLDPGNNQIQYLLGLTYFELKSPELSNQYLLYANQNDNKYQTIILEKLAENAISTDDLILATHYLETLLEKQADHKNALSRLIWLHTEKQNNYDQALIYAQKLVKYHNNDANSYHLLSWVYTQRGELEQAMTALNTANSLE